MKSILLAAALAACTTNGGGGGDDGVTTHVIAIDFASTMKSSCVLAVLADADPNTPGPQFDCSVSDFENYGQPNQVETLLPQCNNLGTPNTSTNKPCWAIESDPASCADATFEHLTMAIERAVAAPANGHVVAQCVAQGT